MTHISQLATSDNAELQDVLDAPISRSIPDQDVDRYSQRAAFARICAAIIPGLRTNGHSWSGFADFSPAAVNWLRANQNVVRSNKNQFKRQSTTKQRAHEAWARLVQ